jgi:CRP/FNR family transcriptional regulator, dissimilatory nitrate respiration regulator
MLRNMIFIMFVAIDNLREVRSRTVALRSGQYLFHLGDPVRAIYFVKLGWVHLIRHQKDGAVLILQKSGPGSIVAEASLYSETYHCDAMALGPARLRSFAKLDMLLHLHSDPDLADAWARHLALELQKARLHAEILSIKTVTKRLDAWIASHGGGAPRKGEWKMIANEIGISPEAFYREMAKRRRPVS